MTQTIPRGRSVASAVSGILEAWNGLVVDRLETTLDALLPLPFGDMRPSPLSSDGSPVQVSVDLAKPGRLRLMVDPLSQGLPGAAFAERVAVILSPANRAILARIVDTPGSRIPYGLVGFVPERPEVQAKLYFGTALPGGVARGICSRLCAANVLSEAVRARILELEARWQPAIVIQGISLDLRDGEVKRANVYSRCLVPYEPEVLRRFLREVDAESTVSDVAEVGRVMNLSGPSSAGRFGPTMLLSPDGRLYGLKIEHGRTSEIGPIPAWAARLERGLGVAVSPLLRLEDAIARACAGPARGPEALSLRIVNGDTPSLVGYFTLPMRVPPGPASGPYG